MFFNSPDLGLDRAAPGTFSLSVTCHGPDVSHRQAGLRLDLDGSARTLQNELIRRTSATDPSERMPPPNSGKTPLTPAQIELLKTWLKRSNRARRGSLSGRSSRPNGPNSPKLTDRTSAFP